MNDTESVTLMPTNNGVMDILKIMIEDEVAAYENPAQVIANTAMAIAIFCESVGVEPPDVNLLMKVAHPNAERAVRLMSGESPEEMH